MEAQTQAQPKKSKTYVNKSTKKKAVAEYKSGADTVENLAKKYGVHVSTIFNWAKLSKKNKIKNSPTEVSPKKSNGKPHDAEKELLRTFFIDSLAQRFRKSLEGKSASALIEIKKAMTEKGIM